MKADISKVIAKNNELKGTLAYYEMHMETYNIENGRTKKVFVEFYVPSENICDVRIRKYEKWLIYSNGTMECKVNENTEKLINFID